MADVPIREVLAGLARYNLFTEKVKMHDGAGVADQIVATVNLNGFRIVEVAALENLKMWTRTEFGVEGYVCPPELAAILEQLGLEPW